MLTLILSGFINQFSLTSYFSATQSGFSIRLLGHIVLCGSLHVVWQRQTGVSGEYLACLLYKSYLLLATVSKTENRYKVKFAITLATARIEEANQGRGKVFVSLENCLPILIAWL